MFVLLRMGATEKERGRDKLNVKKRKNGIRENETDKKKVWNANSIHKKMKKKKYASKNKEQILVHNMKLCVW